MDCTHEDIDFAYHKRCLFDELAMKQLKASSPTDIYFRRLAEQAQMQHKECNRKIHCRTVLDNLQQRKKDAMMTRVFAKEVAKEAKAVKAITSGQNMHTKTALRAIDKLRRKEDKGEQDDLLLAMEELDSNVVTMFGQMGAAEQPTSHVDSFLKRMGVLSPSPSTPSSQEDVELELPDVPGTEQETRTVIKVKMPKNFSDINTDL